MGVIGKVELEATTDVKAGAEISLLDLFEFEERGKNFTANEDVKYGQAGLKVKVAKFGTVETTSEAMLPKGYPTRIATLMKWVDERKKVKVSNNIEKGEKLEVTVES